MIYIVRHGETQWNAQGRIQGRRDIELNDNGRRQAEKAGQELSGPLFSYHDHITVIKSEGNRSDPGKVCGSERSA